MVLVPAAPPEVLATAVLSTAVLSKPVVVLAADVVVPPVEIVEPVAAAKIEPPAAVAVALESELAELGAA